MAESTVPFLKTGKTTDILFSRGEGLQVEETHQGVYLHHMQDNHTVDSIYLSRDRLHRLLQQLGQQSSRLSSVES